MNPKEYIKEIFKKEIVSEIYKYKVFGVPIWRLIRHKIRSSLLKNNANSNNKSVSLEINLIYYCKSIFSFVYKSIFFFLHGKVENVVFAFPRLAKVNGKFLDKYTDPLINLALKEQSYLIFQRSFSFEKLLNRIHKNRVLYIDGLNILSYFISVFISPFVLIIYRYKIKKILFFIKKSLNYNPKARLKTFIVHKVSIFIIETFMYTTLFLILRPKRIYIVNREIFFSAIKAAKFLKIPVLELQHGITFTETVNFTGNYDTAIDPDIFLSMGTIYEAKYFGMTKNRMINIGYSYMEYVKQFQSKNLNSDRVLIVSSPEITKHTFELAIYLSIKYPQREFYFRCHPQEGLSGIQKQSINKIDNLSIQDNTQESLFSMIDFKYIIGENSTVLYEALLLNKTVGILNYPPFNSFSNRTNVFFNINKKNKFDSYFDFIPNYNNYHSNFYTKFNLDLINSL